MKKQKILSFAGFVIALLSIAYLTLWQRWKSGTIVSESAIDGGGRVKVRQLALHAPLWALPFKAYSEYHLYRCEFYGKFNEELLWSCQTYENSGYQLNHVEIKREERDAVTVWFDGVALFECNNKGTWKSTL